MIQFCLIFSFAVFTLSLLPNLQWLTVASLLLAALCFIAFLGIAADVAKRRCKALHDAIKPAGSDKNLGLKPSILSGFFAYFLGFFYALAYGLYQQAAYLPEELEAVDLSLTAKISSVAKLVDGGRGPYWRFDVEVVAHGCGEYEGSPDVDARTISHSQGQPCDFKLRRLRLNWYDAEREPQLGEVYSWTVRLRRPRSTATPGSFDYATWLRRNAYQASGYVRELRQEASESSGLSLRSSLYYELYNATSSLQSAPLILALSMGERVHIDRQQWQRFVATGTVHLMAISGLHIGIAAGLGYLIGAMLQRCLLFLPALLHLMGLSSVFSFRPGRGFSVNASGSGAKRERLAPHCSAADLAFISVRGLSGLLHYWPALIGIAFAFFYAWLAGFSLPTQRALVMSTIVLAAAVIARPVRPVQGLSLALFIVLLLDPLALHGFGFYLSFLAVAGILIVVYQRRRLGGRWLLPHMAVFIVLLLPLLMMQGSVAVWTIPANFVAIPLFSLVLVPLLLLAILSSIIAVPLSDIFSQWLWAVSDRLLLAVDTGLDALLSLPYSQWPLTPQAGAWLFAAAACILLLMPIGRLRAFAIVALLPLIMQTPERPKSGEFWLTVLDVGQGLSVLVETADKNLLYDLGPAYGKHFSSAESVLKPLLAKRGIHRIDTLVLSHGDLDHAGSASSFIDSFPIGEVFLGEPVDGVMGQSCHTRKMRDEVPEENVSNKLSRAGSMSLFGPSSDERLSWRWSGVQFQFLDHGADSRSRGNRSSCVLWLGGINPVVGGKMHSGVHGDALLLGDIGKLSEVQLELPVAAAIFDEAPKSSNAPEQNRLVVAAHHGSRSSSGGDFVRRVDADHVVFSVGYKHQFKHPHPQVVARWEEAGAEIWQTDHHGAITAKFTADGLVLSGHRQPSRFYWQ